MHLPIVQARRFIDTYKAIMRAVFSEMDHPPIEDMTLLIATARDHIKGDRHALVEVIKKLREKKVDVDEEVCDAVLAMDIQTWLHLRDTTRYSVFVNGDCTAAYGVVGLYQGIREITGGFGAVFEAGVVRFSGHYVCDGVFRHEVHMGPTLRKSYSNELRNLKAQGLFRK